MPGSWQTTNGTTLSGSPETQSNGVEKPSRPKSKKEFGQQGLSPTPTTHIVLLASHAKKVLMQMGIEMMLWMFKCHKEQQPRKQYVMFCQHGHEMWIVTGNCDPEYFKYLLGGDLSPEEDETAFLHLKLFGPWNIFNADHMLRFGAIVIGVTLQRGTEMRS